MKTQKTFVHVVLGLALTALIGACAHQKKGGEASSKSLFNFSSLDEDGDGRLSEEEAKKAAQVRFEMLDRVSDTVLTREEFGDDRHFDKFDVNKDGHIDKDEFANGFLNRFRDADLDKDGYLSPEEAEKIGIPK